MRFRRRGATPARSRLAAAALRAGMLSLCASAAHAVVPADVGRDADGRHSRLVLWLDARDLDGDGIEDARGAPPEVIDDNLDSVVDGDAGVALGAVASWQDRAGRGAYAQRRPSNGIELTVPDGSTSPDLVWALRSDFAGTPRLGVRFGSSSATALQATALDLLRGTVDNNRQQLTIFVAMTLLPPDEVAVAAAVSDQTLFAMGNDNPMFLLASPDNLMPHSGVQFAPYITRSHQVDASTGFPYPLTDAKTELWFRTLSTPPASVTAPFDGRSLALRERVVVLLHVGSGNFDRMDMESSDSTLDDVDARRNYSPSELLNGARLDNNATVWLGRGFEANSGINAIVHEILVYAGSEDRAALHDAQRFALFNYLSARWNASLLPKGTQVRQIYQAPGTGFGEQPVAGYGQDMGVVGCVSGSGDGAGGRLPAGESGGLTVQAQTGELMVLNRAGTMETQQSMFQDTQTDGDPDNPLPLPVIDSCNNITGAGREVALLSLTHDGGANPVQFGDGRSGVAAGRTWYAQKSNDLVGTCIAPRSQGDPPFASRQVSPTHFHVDLVFDLVETGFDFAASTPTSGYELIGSPIGDRSVLTSMALISAEATYDAAAQTVTFPRLPAACVSDRALNVRASVAIAMRPFLALDDGEVDEDAGPLDAGAPIDVSEGDTVFLRVSPLVTQPDSIAVRLSFSATTDEVKQFGGEATGQDFTAFLTDSFGNPAAFALDGGTVIVPANAAFVDVRVDVHDDDFVEIADERFTVTLAEILSGGEALMILASDAAATFRVISDDRAALDIDTGAADVCLARTPPIGATVCVVEGGGERASVALAIRPLDAPETGSVIVRAALDAGGEDIFSLSVNELRFDRFNWQTPVSVIVSARQDDQAFAGDIATSRIRVELDDTHADAEANFKNAAADAVVSISDNPDAAGDTYVYPRYIDLARADDDLVVVVVDASEITVSENFGQGRINVRLGSQPSSEDAIVFISAASDDESAASVPENQALLLFRQANWDVPQTVSVVGVPDDFVGDRETVVRLAVDPQTTDALYTSANPVEEVAVAVAGNQEPGIDVSASELELAESGAGNAASVTVSLRNRPQSAVTVNVRFAPGGTAGAVEMACGAIGAARCASVSSGLRLAFDDANWDAPVGIDLTAVDNTARDDAQTALSLSVAPGSDAWFVGQTARVDITVRDDDIPAVVVLQDDLGPIPREGLTLQEAGDSTALQVRLQVPSGDASPWQVTVNVSTLGVGNVSVSADALTFNQSNYSVPQRVAVTSIDDEFARDDVDSLRFQVDADPDLTTASDYRDAPRRSVRFELANDDLGSIVLSTDTLSLTENGTAELGMRLGRSPGGAQDLVGLVLDIDGDSVRLSDEGVNLVFTGSDWSEQRNAVLEAVDDFFLGDRTATVTVRVDPGQTGAYSSATVTQQSVDIVVFSEDRPGLGFDCDACAPLETDSRGPSPPNSDPLLPADDTPSQTVELREGGCVAYNLRLTAFPAADEVVVVRFPGDSDDGFSYVDGDDCAGALELIETIAVSLDAEAPESRLLILANDDSVYSGPGASAFAVTPTVTGAGFEAVPVPELTISVFGDDDIPTVGFDALTDAETEDFVEDDGALSLPIRLSNPSRVPVTVDFLLDGEAERDADYRFIINGDDDTSSLVFSPLSVDLPSALRLEALPDEVFEGEFGESVRLRMERVVNGRAGDPVALALRENDAPPSFFLRTTDTRFVSGAASIAEGVSPTIWVTVHLNGRSVGNASVDVVVRADDSDGQPAEPDDYALDCLGGCAGAVFVDPRTGEARVTVTLDAADLASSATVAVMSTSDTEQLDAEDFVIELQAPLQDPGGGFRISESSSALLVRVLEDDEPPVLPGTLRIDGVDGGSAVLSWERATDNRTEPEALEYAVHTALGDFTGDAAQGRSVQGNSLFVNGPLSVAAPNGLAVDGTRLVFRVSGLFPLTRYSWAVTVVDRAGNVAEHAAVSSGTARAQDADADGLPDHLAAADGDAEDSDGDGLSDDLEEFMSGSPTDVHPADDGNGNGIPDAVEIGLGFPALPSLPDAYAAWTRPSDVANQILGAQTVRHTITVADRHLVAAHIDEPYTRVVVNPRPGTSLPNPPDRVRPWLRRGSFCGRGALPIHYRRICTPAEDESLSSTTSATFLLPAGMHRLWWMVEDQEGNWPLAGAATQTIYVAPRVRFEFERRAETNEPVRIGAYLSGEPVVASEFSLPFVVTRDDTGSEDHEVDSTGSLSFAPGAMRGGVDILPGRSTGTMVFELDLEAAAFCSVDPSSPCPLDEANLTAGLVPGQERGALAAVFAGDASHALTVVEEVAAPLEFSLTVQSAQFAAPVSTVALDDATNLSVLSLAPDEPGLEYDWRLTDVPFLPDVSLQPASGPTGYAVPLRSRDVAPGLYRVGLRLSRGAAAPATRSLWLYLVDSVGALRAVDRDRDGLTDIEEGWLDVDTDGIPDYLDALNRRAAPLPLRHRAFEVVVLAASGATETRTVSIPDPDADALTVTDGLSLSLGATALAASEPPRGYGAAMLGYVAKVSAEDIRNHGDRGRAAVGAGAVADDPDMEAVGVFDFIVSGFPAFRAYADVVLPLDAPLPVDPEYRGYRPGNGWQRFIAEAPDRVDSSERAVDGRCPAADAAAWDAAQGLVQGHRCVRLRLADGGPNDADGAVDGAISQLVGFDATAVSGILVGDSSGSGAGAGCALAQASAGVDLALALALVAAALCALARRRAAASALALALAAALPGGARAEESWREWGAGASGLWRGAYAGAGLASTEVAPGVFGPRYRLGSTRDTGPRLAVGYRLARHWALEAFWADLGEAEILDLARAGAPASATYRQRGMLVSYRRARPEWLGIGRGLEGLGIAWGWFVSAGWADQDAECRGCEFAGVDEGALTLGVGVDLATPGPWTVRVHYERYGDDSSAAALSWLFGAAAPPRGGGGR